MVRQDGSSSRTSPVTVELPDPGEVKEPLPPYKHPYRFDPRHPCRTARRSCPSRARRFESQPARAMEESMPVIEEIYGESDKRTLRSAVRPLGRRVHDR